MPGSGLPASVVECYRTHVIEPVDRELARHNPRSTEYRMGVLDAYAFHALRNAILRVRYVVGTAQADAYFAGLERGHALWRQHQEAKQHRSTSSIHNEEQ